MGDEGGISEGNVVWEKSSGELTGFSGIRWQDRGDSG